MLFAQLPSLQARFMATLDGMPEFKRDSGEIQYALGGFSALGVPSSFHNELVREMRVSAMKSMIPLFSHLCGPSEKFDQIVDRMLYRPAGKAPSAESWHRDCPPDGHERNDDERTLGGWWNLDDKPQHFICSPGSHLDKTEGRGFSKAKKPLVVDETTVIIPPGAILLFYETILHRVAGKKVGYAVKRLFLGWRISQSEESCIPNLGSKLESQAIMPLKSGQLPPMFAALHLVNWIDKLEEWSVATFPQHLLMAHEIKSGARAGDIKTIIPRYFPSLLDLDLPLYPAYEEHEISILRPQREWLLPLDGVMTLFSL